jgi:hypothetical protein|tara:strand:+ start:760 stop:2157 length:1398 start_codon:yes stop_codon:yes gene_type:complete
MNLNYQEPKDLDLMNLNLANDPLLQKEVIFNNKINIYKILVRLEDFTKNNKGQFYKKIPFLIDSNNYIQKLLSKLPKKYRENNYIKLRKVVCEYQSSHNLRLDTFRNFIKNKYYPLTFLRVISKLTDEKELFEIIDKSYITDFSRFNKIKLFTDTNKLPNFLFYLFGIILGDGTLNKERIKIVDGDEREDKIGFSKEFLDSIRRKISETFDTRVPQVQKIKNKNCYELIFHNKWLCYFLNSLFGLEFGKKINPKIQRDFVFTDYQKSLIIRGLFDTDGSANKNKVSFATKFNTLKREILQFLKDKDIKNVSIRIISKDRINPVHSLVILAEDVYKYAKLIGFSHPRKSMEIKQYILSNSNERIVSSSKEKRLAEIGHYFRPIANQKLSIISDFFKLNDKKKQELIDIFNDRFGCDFNKLIKRNRHINNRKITRLHSQIFEYEPKRKAASNQTADKLHEIWLEIWN